MSNALMVLDKFDTLKRAAVALHASGYFSDADSKAKAIAKVMAGAELGLPPFASMTNIHIIKGKPVLGANLIATLIKNDPRYDYRVLTNDNELCEIAFFEHGEVVGRSSFSTQDAKAAGLTGGNWSKYPRNMLFARAISNGARWYTPGIFGGSPVYTPDEMGVEVDEDGFIDGEYSISDNGQHEQPEPEQVIDGEVDPSPKAEPKPSPDLPEGPVDAGAWRERIANNPRPTVATVASALVQVWPSRWGKNIAHAQNSILSRWPDLEGPSHQLATDEALTIFDAAPFDADEEE